MEANQPGAHAQEFEVRRTVELRHNHQATVTRVGRTRGSPYPPRGRAPAVLERRQSAGVAQEVQTDGGLGATVTSAKVPARTDRCARVRDVRATDGQCWSAGLSVLHAA